MHLIHLCLILLFANLGWGALYTKFDDLPSDTFDFVIVGAGGAGPVVANRLTEDPRFSVLLLEAGPSADGLINYTVPLFYLYLREPSALSWNYTLKPQPGLNGRVLPHVRARVLGGCTAHNGMGYQRGSSEDYDRYAAVTGDLGWSWNGIQPYIRRNEHWSQPTDHHNTTGQFDPAVHGFRGITSVTLSGTPSPVDERVALAMAELGDPFIFNLDANSGFELGVSWPQWTIRHGQRDDSATSYLAPSFINRPNLHVLLNAQVTQLFPGIAGPFSTVEFAPGPEAPRNRVVATKEVILSAGTVETPHILLNSGIGDASDLASLGIKARVHLPDVGKNLSVHPTLSISYFVNSTETFDDIFRNVTLRNEMVDIWNRTNGDGRLGSGLSAHNMFLRLPDNATIFLNNSDPAAGPHTAHLTQSITNGLGNVNVPPTGHFITIGNELVTPTSRGSVALNTSNPFDPPIVDTNCLATDFDVFAMVQGIKNARQFLSAPAWTDYILEPFGALANATTDAELEAYVHANAGPNWHMIGSACMSPRGADFGVVDPDLRVKGAVGLRVIDASVLPFVPAGTTMFATYMVGERGSDLIKDSWS